MTDSTDNMVGMEQLQWLLACLRAQYWSYQESHWRVAGAIFYGDHLLFERLYKDVQKEVDGLAEKMVACFGGFAVESGALLPKVAEWLERWCQVECVHERGLLSEKAFQACCRRTYDLLKATDVLTLGMDDFLMAAASTHETHTYLLQQVLRER